MSEATHQDRRVLHKRAAVKIVVFYTLIACLWIYFSDKVLALFIYDPQLLTKAQTIKGLVYVIFTALLLFFYLKHCLQVLRVREEELDTAKEQVRKETQERLHQMNTLFDSLLGAVRR